MSGSVGDNVFRASGVIAAAAAGRTGTVDWQTDSIKTSGFTAATTEGYFCDTSGGAFTVALPAGVAQSIVAIADYTRTWNDNNITLSPNGSDKIGGVAEDATLSTNGQSATFVFVDATEGWININETSTSVSGVSPYLTATGGTITTSGDYKIHTFTGPGTFCVSKVSCCSADDLVSYVVAAGGAGGGTGVWNVHVGAGGGAGGFREYKNSCDPYTASPLNGNPGGTSVTVTATGFPITVGGGGAGSENSNARGTPGVDSVFSSITSTGGGGGGSPTNAPNYPGIAGGSGGGGASEGGASGGIGNTPPVSPAQGFGGGQGTNNPPDVRSGGGGGATAVGTGGTTPPIVSGAGGAGATTSIPGSPTAYSGGGGGGGNPGKSNTAGAGGTGGGGAGGGPPGQAGVDGSANTGGGAGGGKGGPPDGTLGGDGGSGIVILRYQYQ